MGAPRRFGQAGISESSDISIRRGAAGLRVLSDRSLGIRFGPNCPDVAAGLNRCTSRPGRGCEGAGGSSVGVSVAPNPRVNADLVNPFVTGVLATWKTMLGVTPRRGRVQAEPRKASARSSVTALVGLSGPATGVVALRFPPRTLRRVARRLLNDAAVSDEAADDVVSELVNIVGGSAKARFFCETPIVMGLATVIRGSGHRLSHRSGVAGFAIKFDSDLGSFSMEVAIQSPRGGKGR